MSADFNKTEEGAAFPGSCNFRDNEQMVPDRVALDERWRRIEALFLDAADLPEAERAGFFDHACGGDIDLRREAESLLAAESRPPVSIATVIGSAATDLFDENAMTGKRFGAYRIECEIGRGGMGAVYLALRADDEFERRVAIKLVKRGIDTDAVLERFLRERQVLAGLDHPNIARLLDGGTSSDGRPWFAMEYVEGKPIQAYCAEKELGVPERCELFRKLCEPVSYAHRNLVIHRDLKPANILMTRDGQPKLLDFGIARLLSLQPGENTIRGKRRYCQAARSGVCKSGTISRRSGQHGDRRFLARQRPVRNAYRIGARPEFKPAGRQGNRKTQRCCGNTRTAKGP